MKILGSILKAFSASALLLAGCVNEDPQYSFNGGETPDSNMIGYLAPGSFDMRVLYDSDTEVNPDDTSRAPRINPSIDDFTIEILDPSQAVIKKMTYGEWKVQDQPIALPVGSYQLRAYSEETIPAAAWDNPVYNASREFSIQKGKTTTLPAIVCTLANIKVTMHYSADLYSWLSDDTFTEFTLGSQKIAFLKGETRAAYFRPEAESNSMDLILNGMFVDTNRPVTLSKHLTGVRAGQWRKVSLVIENADKGNGTIDIKVDTFVQDEEIVINGSANLWEEEIKEEDPTAPTILWPGHDLSKQFQLLASMFNAQDQCIEPFVFKFVSPNGIKALTVEINSDNSEFMKSLSEVGIPGSFDLCAVTPGSPLYEILKELGFPLGSEVAGQKKLSLDIGPQMPMLYAFDGSFSFDFAVTDENRSTTRAKLSLLVDKQGEKSAPVITWRGYDIDKSYKLVSDMKIAVDIESERGIRAFVVKIDSEILAPFLAEIGLPAQFDLCTVEGDQAEILQGLGFPTGSGVTAPLSFDITQFVPVLMGMGSGEHKFVLTVTNNNGNATTKTIHVINE